MTTTTPEAGNLLYSEVEGDLRGAVRSLLDKRCAWDAVLARTESDETTDRGLWQALVTDIGCAALAVPEELGGGGAGWREVAVVAEELGRVVAPVPFVGTSVLTALLADLGEREILSGVATGDRSGALVVPFAAAPGDSPGGAEFRDGGLYGVIAGVADTALADVLIIPAGETLYAVDAGADGVVRAEIVSLDMTRPLADITLRGVPARAIASGPAVAHALGTALRMGAVVLASEQLGLAERCLDMTVEYLRHRRQFGRALASYQALKHRLVDLWVLVTQARAVARYAAECATTGSPDLPVAVALAQVHCSRVAQRAAEECLQLHGGIGFTWEHFAHLYLKRAKADAIGFGTADRHRVFLAELVGLPAGGAR